MGRIIHGQTKTPTWQIWKSMWHRCRYRCNASYQRYGGRGIRVCERWRSYLLFLEDMGPRPSPQHSLDRIDQDGHYEPGNVRWATRKEQGRNRRDNRLITCWGDTMTLTEWSEFTGIDHATISSRLNAGWPVSRALSEPPKDQPWRRARLPVTSEN